MLAVLLAALAVVSPALPAVAQGGRAPFDLVGPDLHVAVTRGGRTLPIEWVPDLAAGDRLSIRIGLPPEQGERYRLILAFLRGPTDRPPDDWFHDARTWKEEDRALSVVVPEGARQAVLFLMPERNGDLDAVVDTVRRRPGTFVRAVQELNQASLDRARLDTFLAEVQAAERAQPGSIEDTSRMLTRSLSLKLDTNCLQQPVDLQAACLAQGRESMLLADTHTSTLVSTLIGAPTDLAFQLSSTPQGGYGYYSPYIGVVRDIFRIFGAFQSTQLQFIPALTRFGTDRTTLLLNAPLSFGKPTSVMVTGLPAIEAPKFPPMRRPVPETVPCLTSGFVLPVDGAPLVYATRYARNLVFRTARQDGTTLDIPLRADARAGGLVASGAVAGEGFGPIVDGRVHGDWGFAPFDGPEFRLANPDAGSWTLADGTVAPAGGTTPVRIRGGASGCVASVALRDADGVVRAVEWKAEGANAIVATVPVAAGSARSAALLIGRAGTASPTELPLRVVDEPGRIDALTLHAGEPRATMTGTRLGQVREVKVGALVFRPERVEAGEKAERLTLAAADATAAQALKAGQAVTAEIAFGDGRRERRNLTVAAARPRIELLSLSQTPPARDGLPVAIARDDVVGHDHRVTVAFRAAGGSALTGRETIEVASGDGRLSARFTAGKGYDVQDATTGIVAFTPAEALGPLAFGPLRMRIVGGDAASDWIPLATAVRLPAIRGVGCPAGGECALTGERLFLIDAVSATADFAAPVAVPDGFTGSRLPIPAPAGDTLYLRLRDDPSATATVRVR